MTRIHPSWFARLRRHRGLWVLAVAVMLVKLVAGTLCLADGPDLRPPAGTTVPVVAVLADVPAHDDASGCVLGEAGGCHCHCAHAVTLPVTAWSPLDWMDAPFVADAMLPRHTPTFVGSLIRPPIT